MPRLPRLPENANRTDHAVRDDRQPARPKTPPGIGARTAAQRGPQPGRGIKIPTIIPQPETRLAYPQDHYGSAFAQVSAMKLAPAIGLEPITCRLTEGLSWPGSARPVKFSSPLHLHKGLSGAYADILAVVPPRAGKCRS